jgi:hypothetical protein
MEPPGDEARPPPARRPTPAETEGDSGPPFRAPRHSLVAFAAVTFGSTGLLCLRNHWLFQVPVWATGDGAANSILVNQAVHFDLLMGNYSRVGFHHPGPGFLYILSFGQDVFFSWLHVVPAPYNGQLLAVFFLNSAMLGGTSWVIARHVGSWSIALLALVPVLLLMGSTQQWASAWMPYLYVAPFLLAVVAGVSVAVGALQDLPFFSFAAALLVHGHIAFVGIMGVYTVLVLAALLLSRRWRQLRVHIGEVKRHVVASGVIVLLFALPIAVALVRRWPGDFGQYSQYVADGRKHHHSLGAALSFVGLFWPASLLGVAGLAASGVGAFSLAVRDSCLRRRVFVLGLLAAVVVVTLELIVYAARGIDRLDALPTGYEGYFYYCVPPLLVVALVTEVGGRWAPELFSEGDHLHARRATRLLPPALCVAVVVSVFCTQASSYSTERGDPALPAMARAVWRSPLRENRPVAILLDAPGAPPSEWTQVTGLLIASAWQGHHLCVASGRHAYLNMLTHEYICDPTPRANRWTIFLAPRTRPVPPGAAVVFRDGTLRVLAES